MATSGSRRRHVPVTRVADADLDATDVGRQIMTTDIRLRDQQDRAKRWLQRQLEWEDILGALRDAGSGKPAEPPAAEQDAEAA
jgi:hypothetical protein